jgi:hypothetical protein
VVGIFEEAEEEGRFKFYIKPAKRRRGFGNVLCTPPITTKGNPLYGLKISGGGLL